MAEESTRRRLAAVVSTDIVGYSRLMQADEAGTVERMKAHRHELWNPMIEKFGGRVVGTAGDSLLIEFASAVAAVESAIAVQEGMAAREAEMPEERKMRLRIGINIGEVMVDGDEIYGDGVNVAARLQEIAEPGGLSVSRYVKEQVHGKLDIAFVDAGAKTVKNIAEPVHVWTWSTAPAGDDRERRGRSNDLGRADKPSIAVLPFDNMSGDPEQEYFTDGMVEEIITALARFHWLQVIARNSSFAYKGRAIDIRQVSRELGVRYVLEGSVRKAGNRVRITGQLIDAATGAHLWADRFDGDYQDIFDLQDRITGQVVGAIEPRLRVAEIERARRRRPDSLEAYDLYLRALPYGYAVTPEENTAALELLDKALELDPRFAPAAAQAAWCYQQRATLAWELSADSDAERAVEYARTAIAADKDDANSLAMAGFVLAIVGHDMERSRMAVERAMELNPHDPLVQGCTGLVRSFLGDQDAALGCFEVALRLSPGDPMAFAYLHGCATSHMLAGRFEEAVSFATRAAHENAKFSPIFRVLAASYAHLGAIDKAQEAVRTLRELDPRTSVSHHRARLPYRDPMQLERLLEGLRKAGLPE